jgi:hypothetical protein
MPKNIAKTMKSLAVWLFGLFTPHFGQIFAVLSTSALHCLQLIKAICYTQTKQPNKVKIITHHDSSPVDYCGVNLYELPDVAQPATPSRVAGSPALSSASFIGLNQVGYYFAAFISANTLAAI